jgi:hypothetical protein
MAEQNMGKIAGISRNGGKDLFKKLLFLFYLSIKRPKTTKKELRAN